MLLLIFVLHNLRCYIFLFVYIHRNRVWTVFQDKRFWELSYDTASLGLFILSEFNIIYEIPRVPLSVLEVINVHTVGHASHVQGALVGLAWVFLHSQYFAFD